MVLKTLPNNNQKIPTLLGLAFLIMVMFTGIFFTKTPLTFFSKANQTCTPINIQITNLTYQSFDISFVTSKNCLIATSVNNQIYNDIRGQKEAKTHYFRISNLKPSTPYPYFFIANGSNYTNDSFEISTFSKANEFQTDISLSWGRVFVKDKLPATDSIIYLNIPGFYPLSAYVTSQAYWNIPLINSYRLEDNLWASPPADTVDEIVILTSEGLTTVLENDSLKKNPVPDILLDSGKFDQTTGSIEYMPFDTDREFGQEVIINNPSAGDTIDSLNPQFFGKGPAGVSVVIELNSANQIVDSFTVKNDGSWQWTPPTSIEPGEHSVKLKYTDPATGIVKTITRSFTVLAQSDISSPAFTASNSAAKASPTSSPKPTIVPTVPPLPTIIPTKIPPTATPTLYVSGGTIPTLTLFSLAVLLGLLAIILLSY